MEKVKEFKWPDGQKAAVSFSFDDARMSQVDHGMKAFDKFPFKATFYVSPYAVEKKIPEWKQMVQKGHEIANHSMTHPCSANFPWSREKSVEDLTLERMEKDQIIAANEFIHKTLRVQAKTYAYPCGHTYIGRGEGTKTYIPLVAKHFVAGRGFRNEFVNSPVYCDLAQLGGTECDDLSFEGFKEWLDRAEKEGGWVIFAGHEIAPQGRQTTVVKELEKTLTYLQERSADFWVDTVVSIAEYIRNHR